MTAYDFFWKIDYPLCLLIAAIPFFILLKKKKNWFIFTSVGLLLGFGVWLIRTIPLENTTPGISILFYILEITILFLAIVFSLNVSIGDVVLSTTIILSIQHLSYRITLGIGILIDINQFYSTFYFPLMYPIIIILTLAIFFVLKKYLEKHIDYKESLYSLIILFIAIITEIVISFFENDIFFTSLKDDKALSSLVNLINLILTILIILVLYFFTISQDRKRENLILSMMNEKEKERYEMAQVTIEEINLKVHDLKHALSRDDLTDEDKKEIKETITNYRAIVQTNNRGLNIVIFESQLKCIKEGIDLNVLIDGEIPNYLKSNHVYSLLSNLLDNAIEAVIKIKDNERKRISLKIQKIRDQLIIILTNYTDNKITIENGFPLSSKKTKSQDHGYGIRSAKRIVEDYEGIFSYDFSDGIFTVKIILPYKGE